MEMMRHVLSQPDARSVLTLVSVANEPLLEVAMDARLRTALSASCLRQVGRIRTGVAHFDIVERLRERIARRPAPAILQRLADLDPPVGPPGAVPPAAKRRSRAVDFPDPPLPDTADIIAIRTQADLRAEGCQMGHCAGTNEGYARRVAGGAGYFYRVLRPERATAFIVRSGVVWRLEEVKGLHNARVQATTRRSISLWLTSAASTVQRPLPHAAASAVPKPTCHRHVNDAQLAFDFMPVLLS
jgi:hypothetical protein